MSHIFLSYFIELDYFKKSKIKITFNTKNAVDKRVVYLRLVVPSQELVLLVQSPGSLIHVSFLIGIFGG